MNFFERVLYFLQGDMEPPVPWGWFHFMWIGLIIFFIAFLFAIRNDDKREKQLKWVLALYGIITFILELLKQLIWAFNYDPNTDLVTWNYSWYSAPFQLCTTPMIVALICLFLKKNKVRDSMLSYVAFYTMAASISVVLLPDSCFTYDILVNIHTMYLHCGSLVVSAFLLLSKEIKIDYKNVLHGLYVFLIFVLIADLLNIFVYKSGVLNGETFNMFYISPYFPSSLPVFSTMYDKMPYVVFLFSYILALFLGANIIFGVGYLVKALGGNKKDIKRIKMIKKTA